MFLLYMYKHLSSIFWF